MTPDAEKIANAMNRSKRELGKTGIMVSPLCYGCASVYGRDLISDQTAIDLFLMAHELGINFFDTGRGYGMAEARIGAALKSVEQIDRESHVLSTKFDLCESRQKIPQVFDLDWAKRSVEKSLETIGVDYLDIIMVHEPEPAAFFNESLFGFLEDIKRQGIAKAVGVNTYDADFAERVAREKPLDVVMIDHNLVTKRHETIAKLHEAGIGVIAGQGLTQGSFFRKRFFVKNRKDFWYLMRSLKSPASRPLYPQAKKYRFISGLRGFAPAHVALNYALSDPNVSAVSFNSCDFSHLRQDAEAVTRELPKELFDRLRSL
jgi:aryl-alcohol dehydrogenase-like predicted oxidoreductase